MSHVVGMNVVRGQGLNRTASTYRWTCSCGACGDWVEGRKARSAVRLAGIEHRVEAGRVARGEAEGEAA